MNNNRIIIRIVIIILIIPYLNIAQSKEEILDEAYRLYNSEMASWIGTDLLLSKYSDISNQIGGYFSYEDENYIKCIFFDKNQTPKSILAIQFSKDFDSTKTSIDTNKRKLIDLEGTLFLLRQRAIEIIQSDTIFKHYENTRLNIIPLVSQNKSIVYVLTGPQVPNLIVIGNDYLLQFDSDNELIEKKPLHKNILLYKLDNTTNADISFHTHKESTGELITATDICTLLLYEKYTNWKQHYILSDKQVSIWDCKKNELNIISREVWDKIYSNQNK